jgi:hypothetical protein
MRYAISAAAGYVAFLCLIGGLIAWKRRRPDLDFGDLDLPAPRGGGATFDGFGGGRSGGGGASYVWGGGRSSSNSGGGSWIDVDDLGWLVVALLAALAGAVAVMYVVWTAPALLAEVFVDAAIVSAVSRRLTRAQRRDWTATLLRRTVLNRVEPWC